MTTYDPSTRPQTSGIDVNTSVISPVDRVRLPSVIAGLLTTLSTLAVLSVLGLAIGLSRYDGTGNDNALGLSAGLWGAISALIAFFLGGLVAARSAATASGPRNGIFNGAMMWMAAIVLIIMLVGGGIGSLLGLAGNVATSAASTAGAAAGASTTSGNATGATTVDPGAAVATAIPGGAAALPDTPAERDQIAQDASQASWGVLLTLGLSAAAALAGGALGAGTDRRIAQEQRTDRREMSEAR